MSIAGTYMKVSERADQIMKRTKTADSPSGLLKRSKLDTSTPKSQYGISDDIAEIIVAIRKQREELINGSTD